MVAAPDDIPHEPGFLLVVHVGVDVEHIVPDSSDTGVVGGTPGTAEPDVHIHPELPLPGGPEEGGEVTEVGTYRSEPHEVGLETVDLVSHDPDVLGLLGNLDSEGLLTGHAVKVGVHHRCRIAETVGHRDDLGIRPVLGLLLPSPVKVSYDGVGIGYDFSVRLDLKGPETVGEGVLRTHGDPHLVGIHGLGGVLLHHFLGNLCSFRDGLCVGNLSLFLVSHLLSSLSL